MKIGIDLDDVLADSTKALLKAYNTRYKSKIPKLDPIWQTWEKHYGKSVTDRLLKIFQAHKFLESLKPVRGSIKAVRELTKKGVKFHIITSRSVFLKGMTLQWIHDHFGSLIHEVNLTGSKDGKHAKSKENVCRVNKIRLFVDDNPFTFSHWKSIKGVLYDKPWNRHIEEFERVKNWKELQNYVESNRNRFV